MRFFVSVAALAGLAAAQIKYVHHNANDGIKSSQTKKLNSNASQ